ncbi:MAG: hypothetical protein KDD65_01355 [Bacteroidetes bacterium]|nr:hypothetical protein [Bacteroidota bacterium]
MINNNCRVRFRRAIRNAPAAFALATFILSTASPVTGQILTGGARAAAMGGAATALRGDAWTDGNPAVAGTRSGRSLAFFASQSFGLSELRYSAFQYIEPTTIGAFSLGASSFGFSDFRRTDASVGYGRGFAFGAMRKAYFGMLLSYRSVTIAGYGAQGAVDFSLGGMVELASGLDLGFSATNVSAADLGNGGELPRSLAVGLAFRPSEPLLVSADAYQEIGYPLSARVGIELLPVDVLYVRAGAVSQPAGLTFGAGVRLGLVAVDISAQRHEVLGWSPAGGLSMLW